MKREIHRKSLHLLSVGVPLLVWLLPRAVAAPLLVGAAGVALGVDLARLRLRPARYLFLRRTRTLLRPHERRGFTGATWMAGSYALALLLLPKPVAVAAMLFNGLGDAAAALVGRRWGRRRTPWGKSWEGFAAGFAVNLGVALAVGTATGGFGPAAGIAGALVAAAAEFAPLPLDDNVRVTLLGGAAVVAVGMLVGG